MNDDVTSQFYFDEYRIEDINFRINDKFKHQDVNVEFSTDFDLSIHDEKNKGISKINIKFWTESPQGEYPFELEVCISGVFSANESMDQKQFETMCKYNGAAILFPYLRSAITDITKVANVSSLILPTINIKKLIKDKENNN